MGRVAIKYWQEREKGIMARRKEGTERRRQMYWQKATGWSDTPQRCPGK